MKRLTLLNMSFAILVLTYILLNRNIFIWLYMNQPLWRKYLIIFVMTTLVYSFIWHIFELQVVVRKWEINGRSVKRISIEAKNNNQVKNKGEVKRGGSHHEKNEEDL